MPPFTLAQPVSLIVSFGPFPSSAFISPVRAVICVFLSFSAQASPTLLRVSETSRPVTSMLRVKELSFVSPLVFRVAPLRSR